MKNNIKLSVASSRDYPIRAQEKEQGILKESGDVGYVHLAETKRTTE
jgi:hypothetical protein